MRFGFRDCRRASQAGSLRHEGNFELLSSHPYTHARSVWQRSPVANEGIDQQSGCTAQRVLPPLPHYAYFYL
jgi:hypothetical protein